MPPPAARPAGSDDARLVPRPPSPGPDAVLERQAPTGPSAVAVAELRGQLHGLARRLHEDVRLDRSGGVGATLLVEGRPVFGGSNGFTEAVDEVQYRLEQGPCVAAVASGRVVRSRTIGSGERRWTSFTAAAAPLGLRSVASLPVRVADRVVGSLNLYGRHAASLDGASTPALRRASAAAGRGMTAAWLLAVAEANARILADAVRDREDIDIAVGLLMDRYLMTSGSARVLIAQLAVQDDVSKATAARSLTHPDADRG